MAGLAGVSSSQLMKALTAHTLASTPSYSSAAAAAAAAAAHRLPPTARRFAAAAQVNSGNGRAHAAAERSAASPSADIRCGEAPRAMSPRRQVSYPCVNTVRAWVRRLCRPHRPHDLASHSVSQSASTPVRPSSNRPNRSRSRSGSQSDNWKTSKSAGGFDRSRPTSWNNNVAAGFLIAHHKLSDDITRRLLGTPVGRTIRNDNKISPNHSPPVETQTAVVDLSLPNKMNTVIAGYETEAGPILWLLHSFLISGAKPAHYQAQEADAHAGMATHYISHKM